MFILLPCCSSQCSFPLLDKQQVVTMRPWTRQPLSNSIIGRALCMRKSSHAEPSRKLTSMGDVGAIPPPEDTWHHTRSLRTHLIFKRHYIPFCLSKFRFLVRLLVLNNITHQNVKISAKIFSSPNLIFSVFFFKLKFDYLNAMLVSFKNINPSAKK